MYCLKCGAALADGVDVCPKCGEAQNAGEANLQQIYQNLLAEKQNIESGKSKNKQKPPRILARMLVLLFFTLGAVASLYLSYPLQKGLVIRGYDPALSLLRGFIPKFLSGIDCGFDYISSFGGFKGIVAEAMQYLSLITLLLYVMALIALCCGARYRRGVRACGVLCFSFAFICNLLHVLGYIILFPIESLGFGGIIAVAVSLLMLILFACLYSAPKSKNK